MAFQIPKIEWLNVSKTANTHTSTTVDAISNTEALQPGMFVKGSGVQAGTTIVSVAVNSIVISIATTSTLVATSLAFGFSVEFDYQPVEPNGAKIDAKEKISTSISGINQVSVDYLEESRDFRFSFLSQTIFNLVKTFMETHALLGFSFRYFEDKTSVNYTDYQLSELKFTPKKIAPKGMVDFVWDIPLKMRRAL